MKVLSFRYFELVLILLSFLFSSIALVQSARSLRVSSRVEKELVSILKSNEELRKDFNRLSDNLELSLKSIDQHFLFIEKYAQTEYYRIYGDVGQITNKDKTVKPKNK